MLFALRFRCPVLLFVLALLVGCGAVPFERRSPLDQWSQAVLQRDYATAQRLMVQEDIAAWRAATEQFEQHHHATKSYQRSDIPKPPGQNPIAQTTWTWQDGFVRCLRVQQMADGLIDVLDPGYQACEALGQPALPDLPHPPAQPRPSTLPVPSSGA